MRSSFVYILILFHMFRPTKYLFTITTIVAIAFLCSVLASLFHIYVAICKPLFIPFALNQIIYTQNVFIFMMHFSLLLFCGGKISLMQAHYNPYVCIRIICFLHPRYYIIVMEVVIDDVVVLAFCVWVCFCCLFSLI